MSETPPLEQFNLFVYILESPAESDLYYKRNEGEALQRALELIGVTSVHRLVISRSMLQDALNLGLTEAVEGKPPGVPCVHLSAHGSDDGIRLSNGDFVTWRDLSQLLEPAKKHFGELLLCMSSCEGFGAYRLAMTEGTPPFDILVGTQGRPSWSESMVAFSSFYHLLAKGCEIDVAIKGMQAASGHTDFGAGAAVSIQDVFKRRRAERRAAAKARE